MKGVACRQRTKIISCHGVFAEPEGVGDWVERMALRALALNYFLAGTRGQLNRSPASLRLRRRGKNVNL